MELVADRGPYQTDSKIVITDKMPTDFLKGEDNYRLLIRVRESDWKDRSVPFRDYCDFRIQDEVEGFVERYFGKRANDVQLSLAEIVTNMAHHPFTDASQHREVVAELGGNDEYAWGKVSAYGTNLTSFDPMTLKYRKLGDDRARTPGQRTVQERQSGAIRGFGTGIAIGLLDKISMYTGAQACTEFEVLLGRVMDAETTLSLLRRRRVG